LHDENGYENAPQCHVYTSIAYFVMPAINQPSVIMHPGIHLISYCKEIDRNIVKSHLLRSACLLAVKWRKKKVLVVWPYLSQCFLYTWVFLWIALCCQKVKERVPVFVVFPTTFTFQILNTNVWREECVCAWHERHAHTPNVMLPHHHN